MTRSGSRLGGLFFTGWLMVLAGSPAAAQVKRVPLLANGQVWAQFGAQNRTRIEIWRNVGFGDPHNDDDAYILNRLLVRADLHLGRRIKTVVEIKSAVLTNRDLPGGRRPSDADDLDFQNAYLELELPSGKNGAIGLRGGRQELLFGHQRLVSPLDWTNTRRTFDAVRGTVRAGSWTLDGLLAQPVRILKSQINRRDRGTDLLGVYAVKKSGRTPAMDLYWLVLIRDSATVNGTTGRETRHTVGGRLSGGTAKLDYDLEATYQFGTLGTGSISAGMVAADLGLGFPTASASPQLRLGVDVASGDGSEGGDVETFNQLFPLGHAFLGFIDAVGRQNIVGVNAGVRLRRAPIGQVDMTAHRFWRLSTADALYNATGQVERGPGVAAAANVGTEIDLTVRSSLGRHVVTLVGYSRLWPGGFVRQTGAADAIGFAHGSLQITY